MTNKPTKLDIQLWIPAATDIFKSIMPPINAPYPQVIIANGRNFRSIDYTTIPGNSNSSYLPKKRVIYW